MGEGIWYGIIAALVFWGIVCTAYIIILKIFKTGTRGSTVLVLDGNDDSGEIGSVLYGAYLRMNILGEISNGKIIIADSGLSEEQLALCRKITGECGNIEICKIGDLPDFLQERKNNGFTT